ncbi:hypothetical protein HBI56_218080 [Parastagonospora nodorum]|uniref:Uncharacterized protein n=1 Tax=Phaeosphaeria nodorum (strain SN15 / ATCC MYA-4574 / FGSC 10173) TaxID=321614 RepID=Q0UTV3_PHANO|nr:hypothetical protein SNOG_04811 [Parastagonospora nodorum SN15]KAH3904996.1 hypothetical protein HBH56_225970 [Parastagonospora nodorum]EAT87202.1 hypothetical protein SNOG_04811 [Parastagonospora nodorum SN15]KAH3940090.1 hypothetical protein HBH53_224010 [Parastagonospora nodorum]KAH3957579.1 hypothetical protein HBH51_222690 [Parastagonospora nodorum]KAH3992172.1 hypothetical protein HBI10_220270 [Parastagonospora nodorum]
MTTIAKTFQMTIYHGLESGCPETDGEMGSIDTKRMQDGNPYKLPEKTFHTVRIIGKPVTDVLTDGK